MWLVTLNLPCKSWTVRKNKFSHEALVIITQQEMGSFVNKLLIVVSILMHGLPNQPLAH